MDTKMPPAGDLFSGPWNQIQSNVDRQTLQDNVLWQTQPRTSSATDALISPFTSTCASAYNIPHMAMPITDFADSSLAMASSFPGSHHQASYTYPVDVFQWNSEAAQPMFEDNYLAFETASSSGSYAPSLDDIEHLAPSPTSPAFSAVVSVGAASDARSLLLSPEVRGEDVQYRLVPMQSPAMDHEEEKVFAHEDSDDLLGALLKDIKPRIDGKYYCGDVQAEDHECTYAAERKCMLRKHLESTLKTNACHHKDCSGMQFSSKAVLTRHEKEAHGMHAAHQFFCPIETCDRHTRGFPREYNMGDHIQRVHRELDVNEYLKKNKRSRKQSTSTTSSNNGIASLRDHNTTSTASTAGVRKSPGSRGRRDRLERQYRQSREHIGKLAFKLPQQSTASAQKCIEQLKAELLRLEESILVLHAAAND